MKGKEKYQAKIAEFNQLGPFKKITTGYWTAKSEFAAWEEVEGRNVQVCYPMEEKPRCGACGSFLPVYLTIVEDNRGEKHYIGDECIRRLEIQKEA